MEIVLIVGVAWVATAIVVGVLVGRIVRSRDRQQPRGSGVVPDP